jgi:hypothetical protein
MLVDVNGTSAKVIFEASISNKVFFTAWFFLFFTADSFYEKFFCFFAFDERDTNIDTVFPDLRNV